MLPMFTVQLYHLREVCLTSEYILDTLPVEVEPIGCDLETVFFCDSITKRDQELVGCFAVAFPDSVRGN